MKASIAELSPMFSMHRMMKEYTDKFYVDAHSNFGNLVAADMTRSTAVADWLEGLRAKWGDVEIDRIEADTDVDLKVGASLAIRAIVKLNDIQPDSVSVQVYYGHLDPSGSITSGRVSRMELQENGSSGSYLFQGAIPCDSSGQFAFRLRVLPKHEDLSCVHETRLLRWG